jgi:branched-subunit amino acid aminotransferase/4-amino-4-deoxychorismate lyase
LKSPVPSREHVVWFGGRFVDPSEAKVDILDRGWLLGDGVFATMRGYDGACFRPERHLATVARGAYALGIEMPASIPTLAEIADEAAKKTKAADAYVRVTISRGAFAVIARPLEVPTAEEYAAGIPTIVVGPRRIPPECVDPAFKTTSYAPQIVAWREIEAKGIREGVQLALDGSVACGTTSNVFIVQDGALITPPTSTGCRPGVTREAVIELAKSLGLLVREEIIPLDLFERADEAFFTSSRIECLPIARPAAPAANGFQITTTLRHAFRELVLSETKRAS